MQWLSARVNKKYKPSLTLADGLRLCVEALKTVLDDKFNADRLDAAIIMTDTKKFTKVSKRELENLLKHAK